MTWLRAVLQGKGLRNMVTPQSPELTYSHLCNKRGATLTNIGKFHPAQNKHPLSTFIDFITKLSIFLQNLIKIFLTVILSYKSLF